jgi:hypothetical protein
MYEDEKPMGPVAIQGDHGPVALKNIRYRALEEENGTKEDDKENYWESVSPIIVTPGSKPSFIKTFLNYGDKKLTHVISVGSPTEMNYSYDLKEGALFQVWRGKFLDVTQAWKDRGEKQLGVPLGSVISLSDAPVFSILQDERASWPDSISFDELANKGYQLDKDRTPTFMYSIKGLDVKDKIVTTSNGESIERTLTVANAPGNLYGRIAEGKNIENISGDLYAVDGKSYYVRIDRKYKPLIRPSKNGQEIIVKYDSANPITYSLIW